MMRVFRIDEKMKIKSKKKRRSLRCRPVWTVRHIGRVAPNLCTEQNHGRFNMGLEMGMQQQGPATIGMMGFISGIFFLVK